MKKLLIAIICLFFLTGCYNYNELQDLGIASSIYIDYREVYYITVEVIEDDEPTLYKGKGSTIEEAFDDVENKSNKTLYYTHLNALIASSHVNIKQLVLYFLRNPNINNSFFVALCDEDNLYEDTDDLGLKVKNIFKDEEYNTFFNISKTVYNKNIDLLLPVISKEGISSYMAYDNNLAKLTIEVNKYDTYKILNNEKNSNIKVKCDGGYFVVNTSNVLSKYKIDSNIQIDSDIDATLVEYSCNKDTTKVKDLEYLENLLNKQTKKDLEDALKLLKENNTDILGLNNMIYNKFHNLNKDFTYFGYEINVNTHINKKGLLLK